MPSAGSYTGLFQHPAAVSARRSDAETGAEILEQRRRQPLGEDIGELLCTRDLEDAELTDGHFLTDKVDIQLDVLSPSVMNGIASHVDAGDVVAICDSRLGHGTMELAKKLPDPGAFGHCICHATVLRFGRGA